MIDATEVVAVTTDCFLGTERPETDGIKAQGIMVDFLFNKEKLEEHRERVKTWLQDLPTAFRSDGGGGWSFLNFCMTKEDILWTGEHRVCECLIALGVALGYITYTLPRDLWEVLPGGMPYITVTL